jgi:hypothetical protein
MRSLERQCYDDGRLATRRFALVNPPLPRLRGGLPHCTAAGSTLTLRCLPDGSALHGWDVRELRYLMYLYLGRGT